LPFWLISAAERRGGSSRSGAPRCWHYRVLRARWAATVAELAAQEGEKAGARMLAREVRRALFSHYICAMSRSESLCASRRRQPLPDGGCRLVGQ
jgi:hypothetical protein